MNRIRPGLRLDTRTRTLLATLVVDRSRVRLPEPMPAEDYQPVAQVLAALGGRWIPGMAATVFPDDTDPAALIAAVKAGGRMPAHPGQRPQPKPGRRGMARHQPLV